MEYWGLETKELRETRVDIEMGAGVCSFLTPIRQQYWIDLKSLAGSISGQWCLYYFLLFCHRVLICTFFSYHLSNDLRLSCCIFSTNSKPFTNTGPTILSHSTIFFSATFSSQNALPCHFHFRGREGLIMLRPKCTFVIKSLWIPAVSRMKSCPL